MGVSVKGSKVKVDSVDRKFRKLPIVILLVPLYILHAVEPVKPAVLIHVTPEGKDSYPGTAENPLATLAAAQRAARSLAGRQPVTVMLHGGVYYLPDTIIFTEADSGTEQCPVVYAAAPGEQPVISGGRRLTLEWKAGSGGIMEAAVLEGLSIDQLWINGKRQSMARFPNQIPGKNVFDRWDLRQSSEPAQPSEDAMSPERIARWANPAGGYIHAMHPALWGDMHWLIKDRKADGTLDIEGGWQNNRPGPMHGKYRFVENIREELDEPGEWFHDAKANRLYYMPTAGTDMKTATVEVVRLKHLVEFGGTKENPVRFIELRGITFRHAARTFMENKEPLLRSDWTVYRGGAVVFNGAQDCTVSDCTFDQVGGNTIFVNNYNRRITVRGCLIQDSGANGIAFVGDPKAVRNPIFRYGSQDYSKLDLMPGPIGDNFPADCLVEDCLITRTGRDEKQTAPVEIDMSQHITVRHCSIYDVPRAGINIGDGCWGGHVIEFCDVFNTVLETGDHGSFNSWGRDRFWDPQIGQVNRQVANNPALPRLDVVKSIVIRNNRWRCDHGWDVDLDDGSTNYEIYNNLMLNGGLKLREGYDRIVKNNIIINNSLHPHCWFENSGDVFRNNIVMAAYNPAGGMPGGKWGKEVDFNVFACSQKDRVRFAAQDCDKHSIVGDPGFLDPTHGDFRVRQDSPALRLGFQGFPMDEFGVVSPRLRAMARQPKMPTVDIRLDFEGDSGSEMVYVWRQSRLRDLGGEEFSAYGVSRDSGGILVMDVRKGDIADRDGFLPGDIIQSVAGTPVKTVGQMIEYFGHVPADKDIVIGIVRTQKPASIIVRGGAEPPKTELPK
jgi:hypothetical protein